MEPVKTAALLDTAGADGAGQPVALTYWRASGRATVVASLDGVGAIGSTVTVLGSVDNTHFQSLGTIALAGNDSVSGKLAIDYPWPILRADASAGSGTRSRLRTLVAL